jgi:hypothetical protein
MTLSLDIDDLLERVTSICSGITGIRKAFDYDEWPDSPPALPVENQAYHLTGYLEEGQGATYQDRGSDMSEWMLNIPLYTIVVDAARVRRSRGWTSPYPERYATAIRENDALPMGGTYGIDAGITLYNGFRVVRSIPDWPGYDGFYMLRHEIVIHTKGAVAKSRG